MCTHPHPTAPAAPPASTRSRLLAALPLLLPMLALSQPFAAAAEADPFDVLGFRLGMSRTEVEAAFRRLNPDVELKVRNSAYRYSDGLQDLQTEAFLEQISGIIRHDRTTQEILSVTVQFSPPPAGGVAVQITRRDNNISNPVTRAEYTQALVGKYGPPAPSLPPAPGSKSCASAPWRSAWRAARGRSSKCSVAQIRRRYRIYATGH